MGAGAKRPTQAVLNVTGKVAASSKLIFGGFCVGAIEPIIPVQGVDTRTEMRVAAGTVVYC
jgi:hypothetical protein